MKIMIISVLSKLKTYKKTMDLHCRNSIKSMIEDRFSQTYTGTYVLVYVHGVMNISMTMN